MDSFSSLEVGINDETVCLWLFKLFIFWLRVLILRVILLCLGEVLFACVGINELLFKVLI